MFGCVVPVAGCQSFAHLTVQLMLFVYSSQLLCVQLLSGKYLNKNKLQQLATLSPYSVI